MRTLGHTTLLLTASLLVGSACTKKDDTSAEAKKADGGGAKVDENKAGDGKTEGDGKPVASPTEGGFAATTANSAALTAGGFPTSIGLIPDSAELVLGFNMASLVSSPIYALAANESNPEVAEMLAMFKDCGLDPNKFDSIVVGLSQGEDMAMIVVGDGIGDDKNAACVIKNIQKQAGDPQVADVVTQDGKKVIQFTDGRAYLVDGRTVAFATNAWVGPVSELIDGKGTAAATNSKKDLLAKINGGAAIWMVANVPAELAGMAPLFGAPAEFTSVRSLTGSIDLSSGATIDVLAGFTDESTPKALAPKLQSLISEASREAPAELVGMIQKTKVEAVGTDLRVVITATVDELTKAKDVQF